MSYERLSEIRARDALKGDGAAGVTMTQAEADRRWLLRELAETRLDLDDTLSRERAVTERYEAALVGRRLENERLRALVDDAAGHLAATHRHANRHDLLGVDLGCAGCALLGRIEGASAESGGDSIGEAPQNSPAAPAGGSRSPVDAQGGEVAQRGAAGHDGHTQVGRPGAEAELG